MPNRVIKESINESRALCEASIFAEDLYKRLITYADDYGRFNADCQIILARLYPRELEIVSLSDIEDALIELIGAGKVSLYTSHVRHDIYGAFPNWNEHQRVRESKAKCPDPDDTDVNDWYLRRFIPLNLKVKILQRDGCKCSICGKYICSPNIEPKRLIKMGTGLFHFDHIVPVNQGGRATEENLRITCPACNLARKKTYSYEEILEMTKVAKVQDPASDSAFTPKSAAVRGESPQLVASCRKLPPESNPIRIQSESEGEGARTRATSREIAAEAMEGRSAELQSAVQDWLAYKQERREPYKATGLKALLGEIRNNADSHGDEAVADVIRASMSSGYKGIVFDRLKEQKGPRSRRPLSAAEYEKQQVHVSEEDYVFPEKL